MERLFPRTHQKVPMRYLSQNCHQVTSVIRIVDGVYDARLYLPWSETVRDCHYVNFSPGLCFLFYPHFFSFGVVEVTGLGCLGVELGFWGWGSLYKQREITMGINHTTSFNTLVCIVFIMTDITGREDIVYGWLGICSDGYCWYQTFLYDDMWRQNQGTDG